MMVSVDTGGAERLCTAVLKQFPFAVANALNRLAFEFRDQERNLIEGRFTVRRPWVTQGVQVPAGGRATKDRLQSRVEVEQKRSFLWKFEAGGIKRSRQGGLIAIPKQDVFPESQVVPKGKRPKAFQFQVHRTVTGKLQLKGQKRTFLIEKPGGKSVILQ